MEYFISQWNFQPLWAAARFKHLTARTSKSPHCDLPLRRHLRQAETASREADARRCGGSPDITPSEQPPGWRIKCMQACAAPAGHSGFWLHAMTAESSPSSSPYRPSPGGLTADLFAGCSTVQPPATCSGSNSCGNPRRPQPCGIPSHTKFLTLCRHHPHICAVLAYCV